MIYFVQARGRLIPAKKKNKKDDSTEELMKMCCQRLKQPLDDYDKIASAWAVELKKMDPQQQLFAKKAINDIIFEGQMGTLHRNSVEINNSRASTPYSVQSLFAFGDSTIELHPQNTKNYFATFQ